MTATNGVEHLSNDLLVRAMDDELTGGETLAAERHLASCETCRSRQSELRRVSDGLESFLGAWSSAKASSVAGQASERIAEQRNRQQLLAALEGPKQSVPSTAGAGRTLARFGWVLAAAAMLAIGVNYKLNTKATGLETIKAGSVATAVAALEVNGETFTSLPYSNPDLPLGGSHVVQMEVPVASLADAGVMVEPTAARMTSPDRAVLADVLLGIDGQPIGVHVLSLD